MIDLVTFLVSFNVSEGNQSMQQKCPVLSVLITKTNIQIAIR
jgi:hypothetical protein